MNRADNLSRATALARLALKFSRVERVTRHEDGIRPETDSDHTIMLSLVACDLCPEGLDRGKVAMFCVVHDLLEADTGDIQTLTIDAAGREAKAAAEAVAMVRFTAKYGAGSWLMLTLSEYERQDTPEARYVRVIDKVLPKLTHILNGCVAAKALTDEAGFYRSHNDQLGKLDRLHGGEFWAKEALDLLHDAMVVSENAWAAKSGEGAAK